MKENIRVGVHRDGSPYSDQECEEIIGKLEALLDGELDEERKQEVNHMVESCEYCFEQYHIEKSIRTLIRTGFRNVAASSSLIRNIKNSIKRSRHPEDFPR